MRSLLGCHLFCIHFAQKIEKRKAEFDQAITELDESAQREKDEHEAKVIPVIVLFF